MRFLCHFVQLANDEENAEYVETTCELADKDPLVCYSRLQIYISNFFTKIGYVITTAE